MKKVVLCNKLGRLKTLLRDGPGPFRYLNLMDTGEGRLMGGLLGQCPDAEEVPRDALFLDRSEDFRKRYVRFMGQLNIGHHSMGWWAMPFTNKNPLSTWLCRNTAYFLLIRDVFGSDPRPLLVLTNSGDLAAQVLAWAGTEGIEAANLVSAPGKMRRLLKLHTPSGILRASLRTIVLWAFSRRYRPARNRGDDHLVITTLTHPRSFAAVGGYRDAYFGNLADYATASGHKPVVLAMVIEQPFQQLRRLKTLQPAVPIVPLEACLSLMAILACTMKSLGVYFRPLRLRGPVEIDGVDLSCLVKRAVNEARHSGDIFLNLRVYFSVRRISQAIRVSRCLYPYENRAWEKMLLLGMKSASPETVSPMIRSFQLTAASFLVLKSFKLQGAPRWEVIFASERAPPSQLISMVKPPRPRNPRRAPSGIDTGSAGRSRTRHRHLPRELSPRVAARASRPRGDADDSEPCRGCPCRRSPGRSRAHRWPLRPRDRPRRPEDEGPP